MPIDIIVENGSQVANANSYISAGDLQTYATNRGYTLPAAGDPQAVLIIKAADYIEAQRARFKGEKVSDTQAMQWPRADVFIDNSTTEFLETSIPIELKNAQCEIACRLAADPTLDLFPVQSGPSVTERSIGGAVTEKYSPGTGGMEQMPFLTYVDSILKVLYNNAFGSLTVVRV